jgi:hypothetical protein
MPHTDRCLAYEENRRTAYAAVTASFADDTATISDLVHELIQEPANAASALLALIQACYAMTRLGANAVGEEPAAAWARYASTVAWAVETTPHPDPN